MQSFRRHPYVKLGIFLTSLLAAAGCSSAQAQDFGGAYLSTTVVYSHMNITGNRDHYHIEASGGGDPEDGAAMAADCGIAAEGKQAAAMIKARLVPFANADIEVTEEHLVSQNRDVKLSFDKAGRVALEADYGSFCPMRTDLSGPYQKIAEGPWSVEDYAKNKNLLRKGKLDAAVMLVKARADGKEEQADRVLAVLLQQEDGRFKELVRSDKILICGKCERGNENQAYLREGSKGVLLLVQSTEGKKDEGTWRFRLEEATQRLRLIGLDIKHRTGKEDAGTSVSTNYLTGKRIVADYRRDQANSKDLLSNAKTSSVDLPKLYFEDVRWQDMLSQQQ
jgi:hypothetical protein